MGISNSSGISYLRAQVEAPRVDDAAEHNVIER